MVPEPQLACSCSIYSSSFLILRFCVVFVVLYGNPVSQSYWLCLEAGVTVLFTWYSAACYEIKQMLLNSFPLAVLSCPVHLLLTFTVVGGDCVVAVALAY